MRAEIAAAVAKIGSSKEGRVWNGLLMSFQAIPGNCQSVGLCESGGKVRTHTLTATGMRRSEELAKVKGSTVPIVVSLHSFIVYAVVMMSPQLEFQAAEPRR